jgi:hypothetical protein
VDGSYPGVWANEAPDASFGVTSPIFLDQLTPAGVLLNSLAIDADQIVTSFSSKSEIALNLSTDRTKLTFMGYVGAAPNLLDVSNANTVSPVNGSFSTVDPTNPVTSAFNRGVAQVDGAGTVEVTESTAYSGNNGRAALLNNTDGALVPYSVANGPNGEVYPSALSPATDGLRNLTGRVNADGTVNLWAITSTVSTNVDQGADPNQLVVITDLLTNTSSAAAAQETFVVLRTARYGEVLRGVSFTPAVPATKNDCKDGSWQGLVRSDGTAFKNQGACVSYVNTGK